MSWIEAIILGLVQGLGEFLPISSSGHLMLVRHFLGIEGNYLVFDIMLHVATLFAVCIVFYKDILSLFKPPFKTLGLLVIATVPAVVVGALFSILDIQVFENAKLLFIFFFISAIVMLCGEILGKRRKTTHEIGTRTAVCMGLMQAVAIFPGVTRSGSTIFGGVAEGGERKSVARFSFMMSIPIILGALVLSLFDGFGQGASVDAVCYILGMATAFVSGFFAIKFMLRIIARANFKWFALYLFTLSVVSLVFITLG